MNISDLATQLAEWQLPSGAFLSTITSARGTQLDDNGFVTALVLRELRHLSTVTELDSIRNRALTFIESCVSQEIPDAYGFWPAKTRPFWARHVPADADDTAIMAVELARYGRLNQRDLLQIICRILLKHRVNNYSLASPQWIVPGSFLTWLTDDSQRANVIDCCVNANVLSLMAFANATHLPGYQEACYLIESGLNWADNSHPKLLSLIPFYPRLHEFYYAVQHAVECGAIALQPALQRLKTVIKLDIPYSKCTKNQSIPKGSKYTRKGSQEEIITVPNYPVCSSAYHIVVWHCPVLAIIRQSILIPCRVKNPQ